MTEQSVAALDVAELLRQATEIAEAKELAATRSGAVLAEVKRATAVVNDLSVRFDFSVLNRLVENRSAPKNSTRQSAAAS